MARPISKLELTSAELRELRRRLRANTVSKQDGLRAEIVLLRAEGLSQQAVAERLEVSAPTVNKWSQRFEREGLDGLVDRPGRGRRPSLSEETIEQIIVQGAQAPAGRRRWSTRTMAKAMGVSPATVQRIWKQAQLKPHRTRTFKLSNDPEFETKF